MCLLRLRVSSLSFVPALTLILALSACADVGSPLLSASESMLDFGSVVVGETPTQTLVVSNFGEPFPALRFLVAQDASHGADPFRPADDFTGDGADG